MTKDVTVKIRGIQQYPEGEKAETVTEEPAEYFLRNDTHYVMYEELSEGFTESSKCMLKLKGSCVELTKKGLVQSHMVFEEGKFHMTDYKTPFGMVVLGVRTKRVTVLEKENLLTIQIVYALETNEEHMADCSIHIQVKSKV